MFTLTEFWDAQFWSNSEVQNLKEFWHAQFKGFFDLYNLTGFWNAVLMGFWGEQFEGIWRYAVWSHIHADFIQRISYLVCFASYYDHLYWVYSIYLFKKNLRKSGISYDAIFKHWKWHYNFFNDIIPSGLKLDLIYR